MIHKTRFALSTAIAAVLSALPVTSADAAVITWGGPRPIANDADVSRTGVLVGAFNVGNGGVRATTEPVLVPALVNGVLFQPFGIVDSADADTVPDSGFGTGVAPFSTVGFTMGTGPVPPGKGIASSNNGGEGTGGGQFAGLSAGYRSLLGSLAATDFPDTITLLIDNLIIGQQYEFQWWANVSAGLSDSHTAVDFDGGAPVTLNDNVSGADGGLGQFAIGRFTADSFPGDTVGFQAINFGGSEFAVINGFQLRAVPEPSTVLFGLALAGVCFGGRRRSQAALKN